MDSNVTQAAVGLLAGSALGAFFYAGLWWTVRALPRSRHPAALALASFFARALVVAVGFVALVAGEGWPRALWGSIAFVATRFAFVRWLGPRRVAPPPDGPSPQGR